MLPDTRPCASLSIADVLRAVESSISDLAPAERFALVSLAAASGGHPVQLARADLARRWGCSVATARRIVARLALRRLVRIDAVPGRGGGADVNAYTVDLAGLAPGSAPSGRGSAQGEPGPLSHVRAGASDPDLGSGRDPEKSERDPEPSRVESIPAVLEAAEQLGAALAAAPALAGLAAPAVTLALARAVVRAGKPVRLACAGVAELAEAVDVARAAGTPWPRERVASGLRSWALAAREVPGGDASAARETRRALVAASAVEVPTRGVIVRPSAHGFEAMRAWLGRVG